MRNNVGKRVLAYLCVLSLCLAYLPAFSNTVTANAADAENAAASADVTVTMVDKGEIAVGKDKNKTLMAEVPVHAVDLNADGKIDIDETFKAMHETYCPGGFGSSVGQYGLGADKLWGDTSGNFGYYVNNQYSNGLTDEVKAGDSVKEYIYKNGIKRSDQYSWFDVNKCNAAVGKEVTLSLKAYEFDENYNPVEKAYAGATLGTVSADGTFTAFSNAVTDKDGKAAISFDKAGTYVVSAKAPEGESVLVSPVCIVTVTPAPVTPEPTPDQKPGKDTDKTTEEAPAITITLTIKKDTETATTEAKATEAARPSSAQKTVKKTTAKVASVTSAKKKQAAVQLKKVKKATGYQVQLSTSKKFTKKTTVTVNTKKVKYTFKKLKSGKTYYVRSRAYRKENKTTVYGKYSRIAKIVVK